MFEKEAEENSNQFIKTHSESDKFINCKRETDNYNVILAQGYELGFQKGAEFGYNKGYHDAEEHYLNVIDSQHKLVEESNANEWHYVKDGDYPKDNKQYLVLFFYNYKGKKEMSCGVRDNLHSDFEIHRCYTEQIIAWKEIVLPELKESE